MSFNIVYHDNVIEKDLPQLSQPIKETIKKNIVNKLLKDPFNFGKPLRHNLKSCRSFRIGDYRVIYQVKENTIFIIHISHRKDCYK